MRWSDLTTTELANRPMVEAVIVLPVAAIEQHGPHLPLSVDADITEGVLAATAEAVGETSGFGKPMLILTLPLQAIGFSREHERFLGTLTEDPETLRRAWRDIGDSVWRAGGRRLLLLNGHGGNPPIMEIVARDLRARRGMLVGQVNTVDLGTPERWFPEDELRYGIHGGAVETSLMLHLHPERVRRDRLAAFPSSAGPSPTGAEPAINWHGRHAIGWLAGDLNPAGVVGDAASASAEAGAALFATMVADLVEIVRALAAMRLPDG